ncbi:MAG TPA: hypothetical protein VFT06_08365 [Flavisolibacter sp.]|jgi:hypothetical protein|nr:hypothetical protein [Flavisolibacter sp.]
MTGGMSGGGGSSYEGSDIATGSQTPEGITTPTTDVFDSGIAGGSTNGGESTDNGNAGS